VPSVTSKAVTSKAVTSETVTSETVTSKNESVNLVCRSPRQRLLSRKTHGSAVNARVSAERLGLWAGALGLGLLCSACPGGGELEAPYEEYLWQNTVTVTTGATSTTGTTTGGNCTDTEVDVVFVDSCSTAICHGDPGVPPTDPQQLYLFSPTRKTDLLRLGVDCPSEYIIDVNNPAASLLSTTLRGTAACGISMPVGPSLPDAEIACIESWVFDVIATSAGVVTEPTGGSTSF